MTEQDGRALVSIYRMKPWFQSQLRSVAGQIHAIGITANQVTVAAYLVFVTLGALLISAAEPGSFLVLLPIWFFLRMALNAKRGTSRQSRSNHCSTRVLGH